MENPLTGGKAEQDKFLNALESRTGKQWLVSVASHTTPDGTKKGPYKVLALSPKEITDDGVDRIYVQFNDEYDNFVGFVSIMEDTADEPHRLAVVDRPMEAVGLIAKVSEFDALVKGYVEEVM